MRPRWHGRAPTASSCSSGVRTSESAARVGVVRRLDGSRGRRSMMTSRRTAKPSESVEIPKPWHDFARKGAELRIQEILEQLKPLMAELVTIATMFPEVPEWQHTIETEGFSIGIDSLLDRAGRAPRTTRPPMSMKQ